MNILSYENFLNEGKKLDFVIVYSKDDYEEGMEFLDNNGDLTEVDETKIKNIWSKCKGDTSKFAEAVFAEYPEVFQINHTNSDNEDTGEYIDRETKKWSSYFC
ncbi:MAG: hypothetical protein IKO36_05465 [Bacteroidaceae bacterium]|nr:hypothetical protein [Bacteroidaceae bacterium]